MVEPASAAFDHDSPQYQGLRRDLKLWHKQYLTSIFHNIRHRSKKLLRKQFKISCSLQIIIQICVCVYGKAILKEI